MLFSEDQRDDERDDAQIDIVDAAIDDEVAKDRGEDHGQADCDGEGPQRRPRVQREDRVTVTAEPKEDRLPEAENPDIAPEEAHTQREKGEHEDDREVELQGNIREIGHRNQDNR